MSDMKLYRGINNIDDDLIEEAERKQKPVIHRYYSFAASAAVLLIAAGASGWGLFRGTTDLKDPPLLDDSVITEISTTEPTEQPTEGSASSVQTAAAGTSAAVKTEAASAETGTAPVAVIGSEVKTNNTNTAAVKQYASAQTTVKTAVSANFTALPAVTATEAVDPTNKDYEYEGRIVMKKFFAMSTALLTLTNIPVVSANAEPYEPVNRVLDKAQEAKAYIEENNIDLDLNSDGKTDIIDMYAFYVANCYYSTNDETKKLPDDVWEKYTAIPVREGVWTKKTDPETGMEYSISEGYYKLGASEAMEYFFTYYTADLNWLEPEFYTENCPEDYYISEETVSSFIRSYVQYGFFESGRSYDYVQEMIERTDLDMDMNSDGTFDFDDILLLLSFRANVDYDYFYIRESNTEPSDKYHNYEEYSRVYDYCYAEPADDWIKERRPYKFTESEFNKACTYFETASKYLEFYYHEGTQLEYLIKYYLTNNKIDKKYFDPDYYSYDESFKYHCYEYEYSSINHTVHHYNSYSEPFYGKYTYYLDFATKFGPGVIDNYTPTDDDAKRYKFTQEDVEAAFPTYYKNVKTGVLPAPDMDMNGVITVADYSILYNLNCESFSPFEETETAELIRKYPELQIKIKILPEIRDNYNTNFDFNENGVSSDRLETECMMMYILNELDALYDTEAEFTEACEYYMHSHPGINYETLFTNALSTFNATRECYDFDYRIETAETESISESVNTAATFMSGIDLSLLRTGDANCDNSTSLADALLVLQNSANSQKYPITAEGEFNADVFETGDGLTPMDAFVIQKWDTQKTV